MHKPRIFVTGTTFTLSVRPGYIKANMRGILGWIAVWVSTERYDSDPNTDRQIGLELAHRVHQALRGRQ